MVTMGILPSQGTIPMVEPGIEPGTSWLVVRNTVYVIIHFTWQLQYWGFLKVWYDTSLKVQMRLSNFALSFDHWMAESISKLVLVKFVYFLHLYLCTLISVCEYFSVFMDHWPVTCELLTLFLCVLWWFHNFAPSIKVRVVLSAPFKVFMKIKKKHIIVPVHVCSLHETL
jgi:hypothetical protein